MSDAILIFTFSPVQSFIVEARRAADLYTGSQILVELAQAAGKALDAKRLIYPSELTEDVPNKLVVRVPWEECEALAMEARAALIQRWRELADEARDNFARIKLPFTEAIWQRQLADDYLWETYWSAANLDGRDYPEAYAKAESGLAAAKFTRLFNQALEPGFKDTLSGRRQALCTENEDGNAYWFKVGMIPEITPIKIRPSTDKRPRERLDAIGLIKRFSGIAEKAVPPFHGFPSTSSMASASFLESARKYSPALKAYRDTITALLPERKYKIQDNEAWPYDGDLFFPETLRPKRLESDYGKKISDDDSRLRSAQTALKDLYDAVGKSAQTDKSAVTRPSPYYAIIVLDGDNMGEHIRSQKTADQHRAFSTQLREFSREVRTLAEKHLAKVIYNGGDDVMAMAPLKTAFSFARELAVLFHAKTECTASAGIALAHHLSPLSNVLQNARRAENKAKELENKNAICIVALKRSGEPIEVQSKWDAVGNILEELIGQFEEDEISSKLPYDVNRSAYGLPQADKKLEAELRRLLKRHGRTKDFRENQAAPLAAHLCRWANSFSSNLDNQQADQLADWLALARFIAKGGRE